MWLGNSLGGGLAACLTLQRPGFFKGATLLQFTGCSGLLLMTKILKYLGYRKYCQTIINYGMKEKLGTCRVIYLSKWYQQYKSHKLILPYLCILCHFPINDLSLCFHEVLLLCPMLTVSDEVKPPWIVQMIFKYLLARLRRD